MGRGWTSTAKLLEEGDAVTEWFNTAASTCYDGLGRSVSPAG